MAATPVLPGRVNWWPADGNATDVVGGNNGTLINGAGFGPGILGQAFNFSGNQYVQTLYPVPFGSNNFSVDLWVNFNSKPGSNTFIADDNGPGCTDKWILGLNGGVLSFHINTSPSCVGIGFFSQYRWSPNPHQWYNLAVTRNTGNITIYVNGVRVSSEITSSTSNPTVPLTIGSGESGGVDGLIDDVQIYNRALTASEIQGIQALTITASSSSLSIERGANATIPISLASLDDFSGLVGVTAIVIPVTSKSPGIALGSTSLTLTKGGTASSALIITPAHSLKGDGIYVIIVTATSGSIMRNLAIGLTVTRT